MLTALLSLTPPCLPVTPTREFLTARHFLVHIGTTQDSPDISENPTAGETPREEEQLILEKPVSPGDRAQS